ncbi:hypothetical protein M409DRAFT_33802, partial [Zasmidium cellare ATCC 36951]
ELFAASMRAFSAGGEYDVGQVVHGFNWQKLCPGHVVDVGGSSGFVSATLARNFPGLTFEVQDLPAVTEQNTIEPLPEDVRDRVSFRAHSFFEPQLAMNVKAFFFRFVLHNWSDDAVVEILRNLRPSLGLGTRVIVHELIL